MTDQITTTERAAIDNAITEGKVTTVKAGRAKGINKRTAPMTATKQTKAQRVADKPAKVTRRGKKAAARVAAKSPAKATANVVTSAQLATEMGISAKTLRARIRRNIDKWEPLFKDGERHVFANNKTTRGKIDALLA